MSKKKKNKDKDTVYVDTLKDVKYVVSLLEDINQPINTQLSSLLQICCMMSADVTVIEYLLAEGANPNYLDYRGWTARDYASFNKNPIALLSSVTPKSFFLGDFSESINLKEDKASFSKLPNTIVFFFFMKCFSSVQESLIDCWKI